MMSFWNHKQSNAWRIYVDAPLRRRGQCGLAVIVRDERRGAPRFGAH